MPQLFDNHGSEVSVPSIHDSTASSEGTASPTSVTGVCRAIVEPSSWCTLGGKLPVHIDVPDRGNDDSARGGSNNRDVDPALRVARQCFTYLDASGGEDSTGSSGSGSSWRLCWR